MSAYLCNPEHIGVLANEMARVGVYLDSGNRLSVMQAASALARANWISIEARYRGDDFMLGNQSFHEYEHDCIVEARYPDPNLGPMDFIRMAQCFEYQACEAYEYQDSNYRSRHLGQWHIHSFIDDQIRRLPGYYDGQRHYSRPDDEPRVISLSAMMGS